MNKKYNLIDMAKIKDFSFSIDMLQHNIEVPLHTHDCMELVIVLSGSTVHVLENEEYGLNAGDVFVISDNMSHGYKNSQNFKFCNIMFDFNDFLEDISSDIKSFPGFQALFILEPQFRKEHKFKSKLQLDVICLGFVRNFLEIIVTEYNNCTDGCRHAIKNYFLTLTIFLSRQFGLTTNRGSSRLLHIASAVSYINNNYLNQMHLDKISAICFLSTRQFVRIFKKSYGITPTDYIIKLRLAHACHLMESTDLSLSEIAMKSGFWDISFFSRQFKSKYGISPKEYRK